MGEFYSAGKMTLYGIYEGCLNPWHFGQGTQGWVN